MFTAVIIVYNEEEFIESNLLQHLNVFDRIMVIDGCDIRNNNEFISKTGLSTDRTKKIVEKMAEIDSRIEFYEMPYATKEDKANFYIEKMRDGDVFVRIDADEFYTWDDLKYIKDIMAENSDFDGITYPIINFWKRIDSVATGMLFDVRHGKCFRYREGANFKMDHVRLFDKNGRLYLSDPNRKIESNDVACYHLGFLRNNIGRYKVNLQHYISRNERVTRPEYMKCREAFLEDTISNGMKIKRYEGYYPEIFYSMFKKQLFPVGNNPEKERREGNGDKDGADKKKD